MKRLYIDCGMGAAGDMLTGALLELMPDRKEALAMLNSAGIPGIKYEAEDSVKCGVKGTHVTVTYNGEEEVTEDVNGSEAHVHGHARHRPVLERRHVARGLRRALHGPPAHRADGLRAHRP